MKRRSLGVLSVLLAVLLVGSAGAQGSTGPDARVENIATVLIGNVAVNFEFDLYNCPAGQEMAIVSWDAEQPARPPGSGVSVGTQGYGPSTGERVQYLTLTASGNFVAGERWIGSGFVACGAVVIPVEGSGQTLAQTGV
jgi:hypothetical protein